MIGWVVGQLERLVSLGHECEQLLVRQLKRADLRYIFLTLDEREPFLPICRRTRWPYCLVTIERVDLDALVQVRKVVGTTLALDVIEDGAVEGAPSYSTRPSDWVCSGRRNFMYRSVIAFVAWPASNCASSFISSASVSAFARMSWK